MTASDSGAPLPSDPAPDSPTIHYSESGAASVKPSDVLGSKRGREELKAASRAPETREIARAWETIRLFVKRHAESYAEANEIAGCMNVVTENATEVRCPQCSAWVQLERGDRPGTHKCPNCDWHYSPRDSSFEELITDHEHAVMKMWAAPVDRMEEAKANTATARAALSRYVEQQREEIEGGKSALANTGIGGIFDVFISPVDAIEQMALHIQALEPRCEALEAENSLLRGEVDWCEQSAIITDLQAQLERQRETTLTPEDAQEILAEVSYWNRDLQPEIEARLRRIASSSPLT